MNEKKNSSGRVRKKIQVLLLVVTLFSVIPWLPTTNFYLDIMGSFVWQYALLSGLCLLFLVVLRAWPHALFAAAVVSVNLYLVAQAINYGVPRTSSAADSTAVLKLLHLNLNRSNTRYNEVLALIKRENPDVLVFAEVSSEWALALSTLSQRYPYGMTLTREDNFGIALYSRVYADVNREMIGRALVPSIAAQINYRERRLNIVATHPVPPLSQEFYQLRNDQLQALSRHMAEFKGPSLLVGDLNVTPWSVHYRDLLNSTGLRSARQSLLDLATWPAVLRYFGIPLDHLLVTPQISVQRFTVGNPIGSDHLPLTAELAF